MAARPEVDHHTQKSTPDSSLGQSLLDRHVHFIFRQILREKTKWLQVLNSDTIELL